MLVISIGMGISLIFRTKPTFIPAFTGLLGVPQRHHIPPYRYSNTLQHPTRIHNPPELNPEINASQDCRAPFIGGSFFDHEGQPYCETHYHSKRGSLCAGCHKPITGRCITAMFRKFHPEHFVCAFCLKQLNKGTFKEQSDKPYCHACFDKLFG